MRNLRTLILAAVAVMAVGTVMVKDPVIAWAQGLFPGLPAVTLPMTGNERIPADTALGSGLNPQTEYITVNTLASWSPPTSTLTLADPTLIDASLAETFLLTLGAPPTDGIRDINTPTNLTSGKVLRIAITQDSTGGRTVRWPGVFKFGCSSGGNPSVPSGASSGCTSATPTPTLTGTAGAVDVFTFVYNGTNLLEAARMQGLLAH